YITSSSIVKALTSILSIMAPKNIAPLLVGFLCLMVLFTVSEAGNFKLISKFVKQCVIEGGFVKKLSDAIACGDCAALCSAKCPGGDFRIGFPVPDCRFLPCPPVLINSICTLVGPAKNHLTVCSCCCITQD
ncbi:hypothetical protein C5167_051204, partial [Papaver somniferum]